ncbi:hypothetical protein K470DRAFT_262880 [Piedraia hortae CBS 480.64]|uniref:Cyanovirin-N domain-containing protein n=1 Tax=Piedraia hortae CBS 480.64 TaxID=1314780 RepID=A0A6A7C509_9PEZI|nr:hypothetical protein K470DRAFT_262880 [Piedraia hortae CBS 480.64]
MHLPSILTLLTFLVAFTSAAVQAPGKAAGQPARHTPSQGPGPATPKTGGHASGKAKPPKRKRFRIRFEKYSLHGCSGDENDGAHNLGTKQCKSFKYHAGFGSLVTIPLQPPMPHRRCSLIIYAQRGCKGAKWISRDISVGGHCLNVQGRSVKVECTLKDLPVPHMIMDGQGELQIITTPPAYDATVIWNKRSVEPEVSAATTVPRVPQGLDPSKEEGWVEGEDDGDDGDEDDDDDEEDGKDNEEWDEEGDADEGEVEENIQQSQSKS